MVQEPDLRERTQVQTVELVETNTTQVVLITEQRVLDTQHVLQDLMETTLETEEATTVLALQTEVETAVTEAGLITETREVVLITAVGAQVEDLITDLQALAEIEVVHHHVQGDQAVETVLVDLADQEEDKP